MLKKCPTKIINLKPSLYFTYLAFSFFFIERRKGEKDELEPVFSPDKLGEFFFLFLSLTNLLSVYGIHISNNDCLS